MKIFGTGLGGLRAFAAIAGVLTLLPFYPLVRLWFGVRAAIIATFFLAISDVAIHFSRQELSTSTTPLFLTAGFYFLYRGLRSRRTIDFILSGFAFMVNPFFYFGGRVSPIILAAALGYLFVFLPIVRLPGVYSAIRERLPGGKPRRAFMQAIRTQVRGSLHYGRQLVMIAIAGVCIATPWIVFSNDHSLEWNARPLDKLIFNNEQRMVQQHGATHTPLDFGVRTGRCRTTRSIPACPSSSSRRRSASSSRPTASGRAPCGAS